MAGVAALEDAFTARSIRLDFGRASDQQGGREEKWPPETVHFTPKTTSRLVPDSGAHTSPGRPRIWRTLAPGRSLGNTSNFSVAGSKRTMALAPQSLSHTMSRSST